jgi:hypothetical protein
MNKSEIKKLLQNYFGKMLKIEIKKKKTYTQKAFVNLIYVNFKFTPFKNHYFIFAISTLCIYYVNYNNVIIKNRIKASYFIIYRKIFIFFYR